MSESLVLPAALDLLRQRLLQAAPRDEAVPLLRTLQQHGMSRTDLVVQVERLRAQNDVGPRDAGVEAAALAALDLITGVGGPNSLSWDAADLAGIYIPRCVTREALEAGARHAIEPSDLLPARETSNLPASIVSTLAGSTFQLLEGGTYRPVPADFLRVPKSAFTSRPAALLGLQDRFVYEMLASLVEGPLDSLLPAQTGWPRTRARAESPAAILRAPGDWDAAYVVKADVADFFTAIDHGVLAVFLGTYLHLNTQLVQGIHTFLDAIMGSTRGLPQGPAASDVFASAYLLPIDLSIAAQGWTYTRYMDDYFVGASSLGDARAKLEVLESWLQGLGLALNAAKTRPMQRATFVQGFSAPSPRVQRLRRRIERERTQALLAADDPDFVTSELIDLGVDEEVLWDLLYHQSTTIEDVLAEHRDLLAPAVRVYASLVTAVAQQLERGDLPDDMPGTEVDLSTAMAVLAASGRTIRTAHLGTILQWFPRTSPDMARYLQVAAQRTPEPISQFVDATLLAAEHTDWALSWICSVPEHQGNLVVGRLAETLLTVVRSHHYGSLTRLSAARALARTVGLPEDALRALYTSATEPIQSEIVFSALQDSTSFSIGGLLPGGSDQ